MKKKDLSMKNVGLEYLRVFIGFENKNVVRENPTMSFFSALSLYDVTTKNDVRLLTGLNEKEYHKVFSEFPDDKMRYVKTGALANETLLNHLDKDWLTPGQHAMSFLLWKFMQSASLNVISEQFELVTGDRLEDVCPQYFEDDRFAITLEELNDAVVLSMDQLHEIYERNTKQAE